MHRLLAGYARFRSTVYPSHKLLFEKLGKGQQPEALFITCSDSRVMPEMMLQTEPGQIFPIRLAGNLVPAYGLDGDGTAATIEYAIRALKVRDVIVCGHTSCGAMKELLEQAHTRDLPGVTSWLEQAGHASKWLRSTLRDVKAISPEEKLNLVIEANVVQQLDHLRQHPAVRDGLAAGTLKLHGWVYDIVSGEIRALDAESGAFQPLPALEPHLEKKIA